MKILLNLGSNRLKYRQQLFSIYNNFLANHSKEQLFSILRAQSGQV